LGAMTDGFRGKKKGENGEKGFRRGLAGKGTERCIRGRKGEEWENDGKREHDPGCVWGEKEGDKKGEHQKKKKKFHYSKWREGGREGKSQVNESMDEGESFNERPERQQ